MSQINVELTRQAKLLQYANNKRFDEDFNDVTILAGDESIPANRMVLAYYSKFFESMFLSPFKERYQNTVEIKAFDGEGVKQVIEYVYTGIIDINTCNVLTLLGTANFLQVDEVKTMCFDFMETSLTVDSCLDVVKASVLYNNPALQQTYQYISDHFDEVVQRDNFKQLSKDELVSLFTNVDRNTVQEMSLYTAVIDWIKHDQNRKAELLSLFVTLDLEKCPFEFVADIIVEEPLVNTNNDCLNAVVSYLVNRMRKIKMKSRAWKILSVGGNKSKSVLEVFNVSHELLNIYPDLPCYLSDYCVLKVHDFIYCQGGAVDGRYGKSTNKVYRLNLKAPNSEWKEVASMAEKRCNFGAAVYKGCLVVAGGYNHEESRISTAELYQPRLNKWSKIAPLNKKRADHVLVVENEKLLAIGGWVEGKTSSSLVERLDDLEGKWKETKSMNEKRKLFAAVACNSFIYAIGGYDGDTDTTHKSVEKYDVARSDWSLVSSMDVERRLHAACVLNGTIYVVGGKNANNEIVKTIECYNPAADEWTVVGTTKRELWGQAVVSV